jgi:uncharacterized protein
VNNNAVVPLPMFPLGTVLFPYAFLPLHIFEPRYRALTEDALNGNSEFGVVLIERGFEVGGGDTRFGTGTVARIVEAGKFPDGRYALVAIGTRRIQIHSWLPDDPYPLALVEDLDDEPITDDDLELLKTTERAVRRALAMQAELGEAAVPATVPLDPDPERAGYQLAAYAPIGPVDRQRLLEEPSSHVRLERLLTMVEDAAEAFAYRLSAG